MYAVIESGGKQHRVTEGERLKLEKLDVATGETVEFDRVLMVGGEGDVRIGQPLVDGSRVTAEVVAHGRHKKIKIVKFNRRKHYRNETGHRQWYTEVKITGISA
jgi:large subunit ribosomal protein L21